MGHICQIKLIQITLKRSNKNIHSLPIPRSPDPHINIPLPTTFKLLATHPDKPPVANLAKAKACGLQLAVWQALFNLKVNALFVSVCGKRV